MELRFWCGKPGELRTETAHLIKHLKAIAQGADLSLVLAPFTDSARNAELDWLGGDAWREFPGPGGLLTVYTSGTTDQPKAIVKDFVLAFHSKKGKGKPSDRWLLTYNPYRWAGISMITHVLRTNAQLIVPASLEARDILLSLPDASHISVTPSLFRKLMLTDNSGVLGRVRLEQVTFGGEVATQSVLDLARAYWPSARITHVYASTEHGDICSVSDDREGIPEEKWRGQVFTTEGELLLNGQPTGDIWALRDGRYYFRGRVQEVANVGGAKVFLSTVEQAALAIPGVLQARAFAVPSALVGQLVSLEYEGTTAPGELAVELRKRLPKVAWPAKVDKVECVRLSEAGKIGRS